MLMVWDFPYSSGPDSFVVSVHIWSSHLLPEKFLDLLGVSESMLLETRRTDVFMKVDGVFSGQCLIHGRTALFSPALGEPFSWAQVGKR